MISPNYFAMLEGEFMGPGCRHALRVKDRLLDTRQADSRPDLDFGAAGPDKRTPMGRGTCAVPHV